MKPILAFFAAFFILISVLFVPACKERTQSAENFDLGFDLKRGPAISCGPSTKFGEVGFKTSSPKTQEDFDLAISMLHSFEYDEAEKLFSKVIDADPKLAIAYWGVAMSNFHTLWAPPNPEQLEKGAKAIEIAQSLEKKTEREDAYINAMAVFYKDRDKDNHSVRCNRFEKAMEQLYKTYPEDKEAAIFYALSLNAAADPNDTTFTKQKKAGAILTAMSKAQPEHPGIIHYIIHSYDYPELALLALPAAKKYASIAPASAHAQHMPSHIFTRLGMWDDCIRSNLASFEAAKCYAENMGMAAHWDEELHMVDYLEYAYLQKGDNVKAREMRDYLLKVNDAWPVNFKVSYSFAAVPARYVLENKLWNEAASLKLHPQAFVWEKFPWQKGIHVFTRTLGLIRTNQLDEAKKSLQSLGNIRDTLIKIKDPYKANQVQIQYKMAESWLLFREGNVNLALKYMGEAAEMENNTQKHPVTPGEVVSAREELANMLLELKRPVDALVQFELNLVKRPNRFNGLLGAAHAAEKSGNHLKAKSYYQQLLAIADKSSERKELNEARRFIEKYGGL